MICTGKSSEVENKPNFILLIAFFGKDGLLNFHNRITGFDFSVCYLNNIHPRRQTFNAYILPSGRKNLLCNMLCFPA